MFLLYQRDVTDLSMEELVQARLVDGDLLGPQGLELLGVGVHAHDMMAQFRQTGPGHQSDIAGANDANVEFFHGGARFLQK